jgi:hypothetical protein
MRAKISIPGSAGSRISARVSGAGHAAAGNIPAIIFWLKRRAHWREGAAPNDPISRTTGDPNAEVVVVLPDNSRDPELTQTLREAQERYFSRKPRSQFSELRT